MYVPSSVAAVICSAMPVWVIVINLSVNRTELPNAMIVIGVIAGISGIMMVFSEHLADFSDPGYFTSIVLIFISTMAWATASYMMKKSNRNVNPFLNAGLQMFFGGVICLPLSLVFDNYSIMSWSTDTLYPLLYLILIGSMAAQAMYSYTLSQLPLTIASMYSYINPLVAVILGSLVLSEKLNGKIAIAIMITVSGIYLVNRGYYKLTNQKA
ncbi:MAG: DMT family transporter [Bacteroidota bacterium]